MTEETFEKSKNLEAGKGQPNAMPDECRHGVKKINVCVDCVREKHGGLSAPSARSCSLDPAERDEFAEGMEHARLLALALNDGHDWPVTRLLQLALETRKVSGGRVTLRPTP
ncbi:MAG: hypothetical protein ACTS5I_07560 [Rhodanobacter sp.]